VPLVRLDAAPAHCGLINIATLATQPPPEPLDYNFWGGSLGVPSEPRSERIVRVRAPAYTRSRLTPFFSFLCLTTSVKSTSNNPLPPRLPQDQMRTCSSRPIPSRSHRLSLTFSFHSPSSLSDIVNQHSPPHAAVVRPRFTFSFGLSFPY
jgi:hypothetical protein